MVLTQDCDLEQDHRYRWAREPSKSQDKWLLSVLMAPLYNIEHVYAGEHLDQLGMKMQQINRSKTPGDNIRKNENPRYHFLNFPATSGLVPAVIDFKHYFSVNAVACKKERREKFVCRLSTLHREDVTQRFSSFLSRIGLP